MQTLCFLLVSLLLSVSSVAQPTGAPRNASRNKSATYSAASEWTTVKMTDSPAARPASATAVVNASPAPTGRPASATTPSQVSSSPVPPAPADDPSLLAPRYTPPSSSPTGYRPAFTGDFATNRNGWKAGNKGDYNYQIGLGKYNIRRRKDDTRQVAFSYVSLPPEMNLNIAEEFTIKVDVVADSGRIPTGGLLFGVRDSLNFSAFILNSNGDISIVRVADGQPQDEYMSADYFKPGVPLARNRDRLIVQRKKDALHFYINDREVRSSPYVFKTLAGDGIGLTTTGYWTSFQKLTVTLGP